MRILVADQNPLLLGAISATFGRHCDLVTSTRRDVCLEQAEQQKFDVVIACDKLADYTGLELLSEIAGLYPETLLIFAATPARLKRLGNRLELFGLLETLSYPLTPRKLLDVLQLASRIVPRRAMMRKVRHVVLESEWDTGERLGLIEAELEDRTGESHAHEGWRAQGDGAAVEADAEYAGYEAEQPAYEAEGPVFEAEQPACEAEGSAYGAEVQRGELVDEFVFAEPTECTPVAGVPVASPPGAPSSASLTVASVPVASRAAPQAPGVPVVSRASPQAPGVPVVSRASPPAAKLPMVTPPLARLPAPSAHVANAPSPSEVIQSVADESSAAGELIELTPESVPLAEAAAATGHVSDEIEIVVCNDPIFDQPEVPPEPQWAEDGAANDMHFEAAKAPKPYAGATTADTAPSGAKPAASAQPAAEKRPKERTPSKPTAAQLEAFERALARRNAERMRTDGRAGATKGTGRDATAGAGATPGAAGATAGSGASARPAAGAARTGAGSKITVEPWTAEVGSSSLSDLAKMAASKRPLADLMSRASSSVPPKRTVVVVGSGAAAVFVLAVLSFGLFRTPSPPKQHLAQAQRAATPFGPSGATSRSEVGGGVYGGGSTSGPVLPGEPVAPPPDDGIIDAPEQNFTPGPPADAPLPSDPMTDATPVPLPQNSVDPDGAGMEPPPPPPVERPGPTEPPSMHVGPPLGMPGVEPDSGS